MPEEIDAAESLEKRMLRASIGARLFGAHAKPISLGPYLLRRQIGAGATGIVFEACDRRTGHRLAVKVLRRHGATELALLKREFRALADIHHPNLVQFYELSIEEAVPLLAMELVDGCSLLHRVRTQQNGALDGGRLRDALRQLVDAISTLHAAGVLHRDLKPSNLLVQPDGRLVVLDFGLALAVGEQRPSRSGTPRYMAPERRRGEPASQASDWYSVGVMLYETLLCDWSHVQDLPHEAVHSQPAEMRLTEAESEMMKLCRQLLDSDPGRRPSASDLRAALGLPDRPRPSSPIRPIGATSLFVGRETELVRLHEALSVAKSGRGVRVHVTGEPGIGKSALVRRFIQELHVAQEVTVLSGRCYEGELVPFNAADGLVEALCYELDALPDAERWTPPNSADLVRLFPVLGHRLGGAAVEAHSELHVARQRAFAAMRAVLEKLAQRRPLVIHLDDLQWGDADSAQLLNEVLRPPAPTPLLLIASYRNAGAEHVECVRALRELDAQEGIGYVIGLGPLASEASLALARSLADDSAPGAELRSLTVEAAGNPLFLRALVEHCMQQGSRNARTGHTSFQDVVHAALAHLPQPSQELVQLLSLSPRPLERELLLRAAAREGHETAWPEHLALLNRAGLLRRVSGHRDAIETYHDRLRETVAGALDPELRRRYHARLAAAETQSPTPDPEFLAYHYEGAGDAPSAARCAEQAGDRAARQLAFEHAAEWFAVALEHTGVGRGDLLRKRADALAHGGMCLGAAEGYALALQQDQDARQRMELRRRAAEMYLIGGRSVDGLAMIHPVLRTVGVRYPETPLQVRLSIMRNVAWLRWRGVEFEPKPSSGTSAERLRVQVCISIGTGLLVMDDTGSAVALVLEGLRRALSAGDAEFVARGLPIYANVLSWSRRNDRVVERHFDRAEELARELRNPEIAAWVSVVRAVTALQSCQFGRGLALAREAQTRSQNSLDGGFQLGSARHFESAALAYIGRMGEVRLRASECLAWAKARGNFWLTTSAHIYGAVGRLAAGDSQGASSELEGAMARWLRDIELGRRSRTSVEELELQALMAATWCRLYRGEVELAYRVLDRQLSEFGSGPGTRLWAWRALLPMARGATAVAAAARGIDRERATKLAQQSVRTLRQLRVPTWSPAAAALVGAALAELRNDRTRAVDLLQQAITGFERGEMLLHAEVARFRLGELVGGDRAAMLTARAESNMKALGVAEPTRWAAAYAPGF